MIHAYLNPLVKWIWFGGIVVVLGTGLAMLPNRRAALVLQAGSVKRPGGRLLPRRRRSALLRAEWILMIRLFTPKVGSPPRLASSHGSLVWLLLRSWRCF